jgi:Domain of unknown function (DUF4386)/FGGY family of carbohydrate kinases, N-terminal domain
MPRSSRPASATASAPPTDRGHTWNILASEALFRAGFAADLIVFLADVALAILLYRIFRPVRRTLLMLAAAFRLTQTAIIGLNLLNILTALMMIWWRRERPQTFAACAAFWGWHEWLLAWLCGQAVVDPSLASHWLAFDRRHQSWDEGRALELELDPAAAGACAVGERGRPHVTGRGCGPRPP